eukprot:Tbor_TRINITY_DN2793_c0_g1::TRINITY_DN2793_c0_g1_i1::g.15283::m.15283
MTTRIIGSFMAASPARREEIIAQMPELFTKDFVKELLDAEALINDAKKELDDAKELGNVIFDNLDIPVRGAIQEENCGEGHLQTFESILSQLLSQISKEPVVGLSPFTGERTLGDNRSFGNIKAFSSQILLEIFSFLPIIDVFTSIEHVCQDWNNATNNSPFAQAFWLGCVQHEYPDLLAELIAEDDQVSFDSNWRTIAAVVASNDLDDSNE